MKVKCPNYSKEKFSDRCVLLVFEKCDGDVCDHIGFIPEVEIPTADLITELKYRSPNCEKCEHIHESVKSDNCFYCYWGVLSLKKDNFKESTK